jgi:hypothetical protein
LRDAAARLVLDAPSGGRSTADSTLGLQRSRGAAVPSTGANLAGLRKSLTDFQRCVLDELWGHLAQHGEAISERDLYWKFGADAANAAIQPLGGTVVTQTSPGHPLQLTLLGAALSSSGCALCSVLASCLSFVRSVYRAGAAPKSIPSTEVQKRCNLDNSQLEALRLLLSRPERRSDFVVRAPLGGLRSSGSWDLFILDSVWQLRDIDDMAAYVENWATAGFDPASPVCATDSDLGSSWPLTSAGATSPRPREPEARYRRHAITILRGLQGLCRITASDLKLLIESRFEKRPRTVKHRTFEEYLKKWRQHESTRELLVLGMHDVGRLSEEEDDRLLACLDANGRRALKAGRAKYKKHRKR